MSKEFKETVIQLMQHPVMCTPLEKLPYGELQKAYDLSCELADFLEDEEYTLVDYIQMARFQFFLGRLAYTLAYDNEKIISYFKHALQYLDKGGIDLSINQWAKLLSLRSIK